MLKRIISAIVGISILLGCIFLSLVFPVCIDILVAVACAMGVFEFLSAIRLIKVYQISILSLVYSFAYPLIVSFDVPAQSGGLSTLVNFVYTGLMFCVLIFFHSKIDFKDFAYSFSMTLIITVSLTCIILTRKIDPEHSAMYFVYALAVPWLADAGAYFVGVFLGKHKLCPDISPKKTIEGAVGGVIVCIITTLGMTFLFDEWIYGDGITLNYLCALVISLVGSLFSILGDLSFSVIKRSYKVKDYGGLIPGHGGILDRCDSLVCFIPFFYMLMIYYPLVIK